MILSPARTAWILGVWAATFLVTIAVEAASGSDGGFFTFWLVIVSIAPLLVVHEVGHAVAAIAVGYKVTAVSIVNGFDGLTEWECPERRESTGRTAVALMGGPGLTLLGLAGLFLLDLHGSAAAWRAGLAMFGTLWTLDLLAPIPRAGIARDGCALMEVLRADAVRRGEVTVGERAILDHIDRMLVEGKTEAARKSCEVLTEGLEQTAVSMWAGVLGRIALADVLSGQWLFPGGEADQYSAHAVALAPQDPVTVAARAAVASRLGQEVGSGVKLRAPTPGERNVIALLLGSAPKR